MKKFNKKISIILVICIIFCSFSGFTYYNGLGTAYYEAERKIFDDVKYNEIIAAHDSNGIEHAHFVEADLDNREIIPMVFNGEVRSTFTLSSMIKYAREQGYEVLAAINGDIFDMSTGVPKGLTIHEGNIVTSGYAPDRVLAFDKNSKATLAPVALKYNISGTVGYDEQIKNPYWQENQEGDAIGEEYITQYVEHSFSRDIDFFNVPQGAGKGLHVFNRHYASSTKTSGDNVEVVVECDDIQLAVGKTIGGTVKSVTTGTCNTPITNNTIVLSAVSDAASYSTLASMVVGSNVWISVEDTGDGTLKNTKECLGIYYSLVEDGKNVTSGIGLNPRTACGIKSNGELVLFEIDGRQSTVSKGVSLYDLANTMIQLDCETAINLDGGGSSVMYVRQPGKDSIATKVTSPSEGSERKVTNAILLVYKDDGSNNVKNIDIYPTISFAMPGSEVQLTSYASNELYEKVELKNQITYSVDAKYGKIDSNGIFKIANNAPSGKVEIKGKSGTATGSTYIEILKDVNIIPSIAKISTEPKKQTDINVSATIGSKEVAIPVNCKEEIFTWKCDENIGTIDNNGVFVAGDLAETATGKIYISYNNSSLTIPVEIIVEKIEEPPIVPEIVEVEFKDTKGHWAEEYISILAGKAIVSGMEEGIFQPDESLTRAQFIALLAKMTTNFEQNIEKTADFKDVPQDEWFYDYIAWATSNGIANGMGDGTFGPNEKITREQMAVILCNYATSAGFALPQTVENVQFKDYNQINYWAKDYVVTTAGAGIINGFETGKFEPQGNAKRGEAAKVIYKLCEIRGIL